MSDDLLGLTGKTAIVTGAGSQMSGIGNGRAAAVLLADAGARVVLVDSVEERLEETADLIESRGRESISVIGDVSRPEDCERIVRTAVARWGRIDVLVNNVGVVGPVGSVVDVDLDAWDECFRVNVTSMMLMSRFAIPEMKIQGGGAIVNVSSLAGVVSHPRAAYATTKGAILTLTRSMASVHGPEGIRVNAVAPGMAYTPIVQAEGLTEEGRAARAAVAPLQIEGTGWDIGEAIVYLCSARARWVTGVCLPVDGGFTADLRVTSSMSVTASRRN